MIVGDDAAFRFRGQSRSNSEIRQEKYGHYGQKIGSR